MMHRHIDFATATAINPLESAIGFSIRARREFEVYEGQYDALTDSIISQFLGFSRIRKGLRRGKTYVLVFACSTAEYPHLPDKLRRRLEEKHSGALQITEQNEDYQGSAAALFSSDSSQLKALGYDADAELRRANPWPWRVPVFFFEIKIEAL